MRYDLYLSAYDCLDHVVVSSVVRQTADTPGSLSVPVIRTATTVPGVGEPDPREWARDALVAMLEAL